MTDEKPIIDFGTAQRDLQQLINKLKQADATILKISKDALTAGRNLSSIQLPSDLAQFTAENQRLTAQMQAQSQALSQLQNQYNTLSSQRRNTAQGITQERVNTQILNTERRRELTTTSQVAGAYRRLSAEVAIASERYQNLLVRGRSLGQTQRDYNNQLRNAQSEFRNLQRRVLEADKAVDKWARTGERSVGVLAGLLSAFGIAGGITIFATMSRDIFNTIKEIQSLDMALKSVTGTTENFYAQQVFLNDIADKYGLEINNLTKQYTAFYVAANGKIAGSQIQQTFEDIARSGAALGLSNEALERSFTAVNQMFSKGTVASEELRGQLAEAIPGAVQAMTKAVQKIHPEIKNLTEKGLFQMIKAGDILAKDVLPETAKQLAILTGADKAEKIETLTKLTNRFTAAWVDFIRFVSENDTVIGTFFGGAIKGATLFLGGLKEILATQRQINVMRESSTFQEGYNEFNDLYDPKTGNLASLEKEKQQLDEYIAYNQKEIDKLTKKIEDAPWYAPELELKDTAEEIAREIGFSKGKLKAIQDKVLELTKPKTESTDSESEAQEKAIEDRLKALYEANKKELELQLLKEEAILNNELSSYEEQYKALENYQKIKLKIISLEHNEQLRLAKDNSDKIKVANLDMQMSIVKQSQDAFLKLKAIREKEKEEQLRELKDAEDSIKESNEKIDNIKEEALAIEIASQKSRNDLIDQQIEKLEELKKATEDWLGSFSSEFLQNSGLGSLETFFDGTFSKLLEGADTMEEKFAVTFNAIAESAQEAFNFISNASQANFDAEKERLQEQYDVALTDAGDNKVAQEKLAEDLEKSKKDIANREAKAKQKQAMFNIAIDTAQGIISALASTPPNVPLSIAIGVIGAAQLAMVASQEVPQYWMGGTHDGGLMMVNDGAGSNYQETIVTPDGKIIKPTGRNVLMDAPAGTEIFTHDMWQNALNDMLQGKGISMNMPQQYTGISKADMYEVMADTLGSQPQHYSNFDADGATDYIVKGGNKTILKTNRGNGRGIKFGG